MSKPKIVETYDYTDESGKLLFQVVRYEPKDFRQRRPGDNGEYIWNLEGVRRVLYRLPELLDPIVSRDELVFFTEGEKDAETLREAGLVATTSGGTSSWQDEFAEFLNDRKVVIPQHNDRDGKKFAKQVAEALTKIGVEVRIVTLPGLAKSGDVSDWLDDAGTKEALLNLAEISKPFMLPREYAAVDFNLTDAGNGERFALQHGQKIRFVWDWNKWIYYDGTRWSVECGPEMASALAVETARGIVQEAEGKGHEQRGPILKWAYSSESKTRLAAMLECAKAVPPIAAYSRQFDTDLWLLNCLNGTIDLKTGSLRRHNPKNMITKLVKVRYDPKATCETWESFLETTADGENEIKDFLQLAAGYSITGDTGEEKLFFIHGDAATGKSTFIEAVKSALGDYAQTTDFETFLKRKAVGVTRNDIARLHGARFVASIEVEEGKKLAEGLVKMLTGGDTVATRFLYKEFFEFLPQFKLWLAANHTPRIRDAAAAMWRRILRIPFDHVIPKEARDPNVKATLKDTEVAGPAILAWMVEGCLKWQQNRLIVPESIEKSTEQYRQDQDPLKDFFEDECTFDIPNSFVPVAELRVAYDQYCKDGGIRYPLAARQFNERLRTKGCEQASRNCPNDAGTQTKTRCWIGVTLKINCRYEQVTNEAENEENQPQKQEEIPF